MCVIVKYRSVKSHKTVILEKPALITNNINEPYIAGYIFSHIR